MTREEAIKVLRTESVEIGGNAVSIARWLTALGKRKRDTCWLLPSSDR